MTHGYGTAENARQGCGIAKQRNGEAWQCTGKAKRGEGEANRRDALAERNIATARLAQQWHCIDQRRQCMTKQSSGIALRRTAMAWRCSLQLCIGTAILCNALALYQRSHAKEKQPENDTQQGAEDMKIEKRRYRLTGITRLLGSQPANPNVRSKYIASKAASQIRGEEETSRLPVDLDSKNLSVFLRDKGCLCICDYAIKGFLKEAGKAMKTQINVAQVASKIDNYVLIEPQYLHLTREGEEIDVADGDFERPLRAQTMQGPRVTVAASEYVDTPWSLEFEISLLANEKTTRSDAVSFETIEELLEYGSFKGLGQWRNGQNGRFRWERMDEHDAD